MGRFLLRDILKAGTEKKNSFGGFPIVAIRRIRLNKILNYSNFCFALLPDIFILDEKEVASKTK